VTRASNLSVPSGTAIGSGVRGLVLPQRRAQHQESVMARGVALHVLHRPGAVAWPKRVGKLLGWLIRVLERVTPRKMLQVLISEA